MELDQYYTKPEVAAWCIKELKKTMPQATNKHFIEPSAGNGSFLNLLPPERSLGIDIDPKAKGIIKSDFLEWTSRDSNRSKFIIIGNPPFGKRARLAIDFFNHSAGIADTIAFIVPRQFQKYSVHSKLDKEFRLIKDYELKEDSFYTSDGKTFKVRCDFQIWTREKTKHKNKRVLVPPPTSHPDFFMYQYNNTRQALKFFNFDWDFAVPRQGYEDYSRRETGPERCERNKQWIMFKAESKKILDRLWNFDFNKLAQKNTMVYGFGKADVVMEYKRIYDK